MQNSQPITHLKPITAKPTPPTSPLIISDVAWGLSGAFGITALVFSGLTLYLLGKLGENAGSLAWYVSRGTGIAAYGLLASSVIYGLIISTRSATSTLPPPVTFAIHEFASWLSLAFTLLHACVLYFDHYINFSLTTIFAPFTSPYRFEWVGLGQLSFYLLGLLTLSFYIKKQIGQRAWRILHYLSFVIFILTTLHGIYSGTDTQLGWIRAMYWLCAIVVLFLFSYRVLLAIFGRQKTPAIPKP